MAWLRPVLALIVLLAGTGLAAAEDVVLGYLSQTDDPRYVRDWGYARLIAPPADTTVDGATMALKDLSFVTDASGLSVTLDAREAPDLDGLKIALEAQIAAGARFVILDLNAELVSGLAEAAAGSPVMLINATAPDDSLRTACFAGLLHSGPSDRMLEDALTQYLRFQNWTRALVLYGEHPRDSIIAEAFAKSAARLRIGISDTRPFTLAADPQNREQNNIKLLTGGTDYDVVFVADTRGEFGRYIPYATNLARPVVGSVGLTPLAWHWAFERDGATQVSSRFDRMTGRKMSGEDWSVWIAAKAILTAYTKITDHSVTALADYMRSDAMRLDGSKGVSLNFRDWNGQLRMPVMLATADAVIAVAPIEGYLHRDNTLDTLGTDRAEFRCSP
ncbi:MAG: amino acid ABC transporter substrate-binding protein [Hyphomicrobiaceae bacterium]|nr:amino acid ABC transporter substrate-binding protein [Hyphomicrobiaceae bacterium]MCC0025059.1 amino acid ABC transporter substrate-binding protein [Hyphomicrobiaceae bacterium]